MARARKTRQREKVLGRYKLIIVSRITVLQIYYLCFVCIINATACACLPSWYWSHSCSKNRNSLDWRVRNKFSRVLIADHPNLHKPRYRIDLPHRESISFKFRFFFSIILLNYSIQTVYQSIHFASLAPRLSAFILLCWKTNAIGPRFCSDLLLLCLPPLINSNL